VIWVVKLFGIIIHVENHHNYGDFSTCQLHIFHKFSFHYFGGLFNDEINLRVSKVVDS